MSIIGSNVLAGASGSGVSAYEIEQSLRFNSSDSTNLSRTPGSTGNRKTFTVSCWVKRAQIGATQMIWSAGPASGGNIYLYFTSSDELQLSVDTEASGIVKTTQKFRDPSAWYHIVCAVDTSQATAANRVKFFINGTAVSDFASSTYPSQNHDTHWNHTSAHRIGQRNDGTAFYINAYIAEFYNLDGTAVSDAEDFAEADDNGVWRPIETSGLTFGTNGAYLKFDETATNGIGHDDSGNGNNWTASGFTTSGTETDVMSDTPTTNWCAINPLTKSNVASVENGNLVVNAPTSGDGCVDATIAVPSSGKFYVEATLKNITGGVNQFRMGLQPTDDVAYARPGDNTDSYGFRWNESAGNFAAYDEGTETTYGSGTAIGGEIVGIAIDRDNGEIKTHINNTYFNSGNAVITGIPTTSDYLFRMSLDGGSKQVGATLNFGQREFAFPPGTVSATEYFNTVLYTGNGSTQSITGVGFQPDLVIAKNRDSTNSFRVVDSVRGAGKQLYTNDDLNEETVSTGLTSFDSDGFSLGSSGGINGSGIDFAAWCWKAGGTASSNTDGSITASVSASQDAGFSVVTWTGTGANATVGHGLDVAPSVVIVKNRDDSTKNWVVQVTALGNNYLELNSANSTFSGSTYFNNTAPTSSVFSIGSIGSTNASGDDFVAYCFAEKTGVSKFGTYTGTGALGNFVELGFKPAAVILKRSGGSASHWYLYDSERGVDSYVLVNSAAAETTNTSERVLLTQSGFLLQTSAAMNTSGAPYIYLAFAENLAADADFKSLNTANLPAPEIKDGSKYFDTKLFTAGTTTVTGLSFQPDWVWVKNRDQSYNHRLIDVVRGIKNDLYSNATDDEQTNQSDSLLTFTSDGFTHGKFGSADADDFVAWNWLAGNGTSSNTNGSITSTVSANATAGFSIVSYTGDGDSGSTVGHGLGDTPAMIILKARAGTNADNSWYCWHKGLSSGYNIRLDRNNGELNTSSAASGVIAAPTNTTTFGFTAGSNVLNVNENTTTYIAYCFAEVEGYSEFGSYTGNGNADGPFIATSFSPQFIILKKSESGGTGDWIIKDTARDPYNVSDKDLRANISNTEGTGSARNIDILSNGFKLRTSDGDYNDNANSFIYMAFASNPFGGDGVSPATAR